VTYGGDSGNRIFVLYCRCPLIRVSVIRGSTVLAYLETLSALYCSQDIYIYLQTCHIFTKTCTYGHNCWTLEGAEPSAGFIQASLMAHFNHGLLGDEVILVTVTTVFMTSCSSSRQIMSWQDPRSYVSRTWNCSCALFACLVAFDYMYPDSSLFLQLIIGLWCQFFAVYVGKNRKSVCCRY
jgi:hypothetical protein